MNIKTVYVEITNFCSLNCITCYNRSGLNCQRTELSFEQIENIIKLFTPLGLKRFLLSGGEPTLHSEFDKILNLIDKYPKINFGIVTNGTNHNKKLLECLNTRENLKLQISLDGSCEEINSKTRGIGNFKKTLSFAKQIRTAHNIPLLKMVISQGNYDDVENFCNLAISLGFTPELAFIYKSGNGCDDWNTKELTSIQKLKILKLVERINKERNAGIFLPICTTKCPLADGLNELSFCIKVDGSIQPCQSLYSEKYTVGNVLFFDKKLFLQNINNISDLARQRCEQDYGCEKCMLNDICGRGCMAEAVNLHDNPFASDGNCEYRKQQFINFNLKGGISVLEKEDKTFHA